MNNLQINKELEILRLKNKLLITIKYYIINTSQIELSCFYRVLDLLELKYTDINDHNFIEQGIRNNISNYNKNIIYLLSNIASHIYNCKNEYLLIDLLNSIDTGINFKLINHHEKLEKMLIENINISLEQNNFLERIEENTSL
jgi:hypothetical protein